MSLCIIEKLILWPNRIPISHSYPHISCDFAAYIRGSMVTNYTLMAIFHVLSSGPDSDAVVVLMSVSMTTLHLTICLSLGVRR